MLLEVTGHVSHSLRLTGLSSSISEQETGNPPSGHPAMAHVGDLGSGDDSDQAKKRLRT